MTPLTVKAASALRHVIEDNHDAARTVLRKLNAEELNTLINAADAFASLIDEEVIRKAERRP
jgi:hypothetical protein